MMSTDAVASHNLSEDCGNFVFSPPLYKQRYDLAAGILRESKVTSVCVDCFNRVKKIGFLFKHQFFLTGSSFNCSHSLFYYSE